MRLQRRVIVRVYTDTVSANQSLYLDKWFGEQILKIYDGHFSTQFSNHIHQTKKR